MSASELDESSVTVEVKNIGGIAESSVEFTPGVTILAGRNATNRTSFLRAIMAALGSENVALKGDAEEGSVEIHFDDETYTRTLVRRSGTIHFDGEPYLADSELADLFAFLLESNTARQAVERDEDLYDVIMRPVDTAEIDAEIERLKEERRSIEAELEELQSLERELQSLEEERTELKADIDTKRDELETKTAELDAIDAEREDAAEFDERFEELRDLRDELAEVRNDLEDEKRIVEALREDRAEMESSLDGLATADDADLRELETEIQRCREEIQSIESMVGELQSVIQFNERLSSSTDTGFLHALEDGETGDRGGSVTEKLLAEGEEIVCWTCGSEVESTQIERTIEVLRELHSDQITRRNSLRDELDELEAERKHIQRTGQKRRRLQQQLDEVEQELRDRTDRIDELESQADALESEVDDLEAAVEELETTEHEALMDKHREVNEIRFEISRLESRLDAVTDEITSIKERLAEREQLEDNRKEISDHLDDLRSRIERLETEAVEQFNEQMETILDLLEFENLERVWIEQLDADTGSGQGRTTADAFDLHIVRTNESGSVYEDTIDHLSESEREVVGLVFALSGYLVHDVYERVPFMLLDSLEALDSERISTLIDYLAKQAANLVVALLPEDAAAVDDEYERVVEI